MSAHPLVALIRINIVYRERDEVELVEHGALQLMLPALRVQIHLGQIFREIYCFSPLNVVTLS